MTTTPSESTTAVLHAGREQALADIFVTLADALVDDYEVVDLLDQLVRGCVEILGVSAAGLLLDDQQGNLTLVASSSENTRVLEVFQLQNDEGPCLDCFRTGAPVNSPNLHLDRARWPRFVPAAMEAGFWAVSAVPLRLRAQTIGTLNMFHIRALPIDPSELRLAQALADVATIGILQHRATHRSSQLAEQLQNALNSRIVIEQAKGVIAGHHSITMEAAFAALRRHSQNHNLKLTDVARSVVNGTLPVNALSSIGEPPTQG
jgi:transcriptional regulator with GAF, ATPase, and Fis domain